MGNLKRVSNELLIIAIGILFMWHFGAFGQLEKIISTATTIAIAMMLGFIASKKFGVTISWEKVDENTKVYFRLGLIIGAIVGYALVANSFAVRLN